MFKCVFCQLTHNSRKEIYSTQSEPIKDTKKDLNNSVEKNTPIVMDDLKTVKNASIQTESKNNFSESLSRILDDNSSTKSLTKSTLKKILKILNSEESSFKSNPKTQHKRKHKFEDSDTNDLYSSFFNSLDKVSTENNYGSSSHTSTKRLPCSKVNKTKIKVTVKKKKVKEI